MVAARFLPFIAIAAFRVVCCVALLGTSVCNARQSAALAAYPVKPVRIITASSPGTAEDFFARALGEELSAFYRQRVLIENHSGAGGLIGNIWQRVPPDNRWTNLPFITGAPLPAVPRGPCSPRRGRA